MIDLKKTMRDVAAFSEKQRQVQLKKLKDESHSSPNSLTEAIIVAYEKVIQSINNILVPQEDQEDQKEERGRELTESD